jgi:hypothetical protein
MPSLKYNAFVSARPKTMLNPWEWLENTLNEIRNLLYQIRKILRSQGGTVMSIPKLILDAIKNEEAEVAAVLQEQSEKFATEKAAQDQTIADLKALLEATTIDGTAAAAKIAELEASQANMQDIADAIDGIHKSPVTDAVITEVINNPAIETPQVVVDAPAVAPEVVQDPAVVQAAVDAIAQADAAEDEMI